MAYQLESFDREVRAPLLQPNAKELGHVHWLRRLVLGLWVQAMLRRLSRRRAENLSNLPPHLRTDIGLPQDFRPTDGLARPLPTV